MNSTNPKPLDNKENIWGWADFSQIHGKSKMDSRRAAHLVYDFVNMFQIEEFTIVASFGEWQNQRIEVVYKYPSLDSDSDVIEDDWYEYIIRGGSHIYMSGY